MDIIEALKAVLFGIVEGITEWLPISSTGHMMLLEAFVPLNVSPEFYSTFLVVIQLGAILAVLVLFFHKLNPFSSRKTEKQKRVTWGIWAKVVVGSIPAAIVGLLLDEWVETNIMTNEDVSAIVVAAALIVYGVIFILIEVRNRRRLAEAAAAAPRGKHARASKEVYESVDPAADTEYDASSAISTVNTFEQMSYGKAFIIGIFQSLAVIPGTSRSGSIIIGSMLVGTSRTVATEFAFFLAIPIMFGWSLLKFFRHGFAYTATEWMVFVIGLVVAFVVSIVAIKFLVGYVKKHDFTAFGIYRIIVGAVVLVYFLLIV
ncbi:MAG TPA: undecaprenyl-diphosphate phosphatase [Candidatus Aphodovivens excrementavium]|nr:undecaprenyl-diphosphate phosphatase [Candidatus Aphodovivens excrementavium]